MKIERVWTKRSLHIGYTDITHWRKSSQGRALWLALGIWCTSRYQRSLLRSTGSDTAATIDIRELLNIRGAWTDLGFKVCPGARKKTSNVFKTTLAGKINLNREGIQIFGCLLGYILGLSVWTVFKWEHLRKTSIARKFLKVFRIVKYFPRFTWVTWPMPFVLPSLKRILAPLLTNSGFLMNLNMTDAWR